MQIEYDKKADTKYIRLKKGKVVKTKKQQDWLFFDYAKNGDILGVEVIDASKNMISLLAIKDKLINFSIITSSLSEQVEESKNESNEEGSFNIKTPQYSEKLLFA